MHMPLVSLLQGPPEREGASDTAKREEEVILWLSKMIYPHVCGECLGFSLLARWSWS